MTTDPRKHEDYAHLFPDHTDLEKVLHEADLKTEPEDGLERRTVAVFRCQQIADERRQLFSPAFWRRLMRVGAMALVLGILMVRATVGTEWSKQISSWSIGPAYDAWCAIVQTVFSSPNYTDKTADLYTPQDRELAAFHQLTTHLAEIVLWALLVVLGALLVSDLWQQWKRRRRRRPAEPPPAVVRERTPTP